MTGEVLFRDGDLLTACSWLEILALRRAPDDDEVADAASPCRTVSIGLTGVADGAGEFLASNGKPAPAPLTADDREAGRPLTIDERDPGRCPARALNEALAPPLRLDLDTNGDDDGTISVVSSPPDIALCNIALCVVAAL